jgi:trimethylamine:corrinoid methyltransferase-like protein
MAGESIAKVGPGGGYLAVKDTARRIRAGEHLQPTISNRLSYDKWVEEGRTENDVANAEVERILAVRTTKPPHLADDQLNEVAAICKIDAEGIRRARRA